VQVKKPVLRQKGELVAIEIKYGKKFRTEWTKGLNDFTSISKDRIIGSHIIYTGADRLESNGVQVWPVAEFLKEMFNGKIFGKL